MDVANNPICYDDNYDQPFDILYPKKKKKKELLDMLFCCVLNTVNNCIGKKKIILLLWLNCYFLVATESGVQKIILVYND